MPPAGHKQTNFCDFRQPIPALGSTDPNGQLAVFVLCYTPGELSMTQHQGIISEMSGWAAEQDVGKPEDSLPGEIRGATRQLTELLAKWQRQARGLVAVNNIARVVVSSQGLAEILATAVDEIQESLGVGKVQIILLDPESNRLVYHGLSGMKGTPPASEEGQGPESVARQVIRSGHSLRVEEAPRSKGGEAGSLPACGAALCVPLLACERIVGAIQVTNKLQHRASGKAVPFDEHDQEVLEGVAAFVAMAVENARLQEKTRTQAAAQVLQETVVTLAHYVNNPLQGMVAAAELLKEQLEGSARGVDTLTADESSASNLLAVIVDNAHEISAVLRILQNVGLPGSTTYVGSQQMLDIEAELRARMAGTKT
jgi:GAF domain-containing protein